MILPVRRHIKWLGAAISFLIALTLACGDSLGPENVDRLLIIDGANLEGTVGEPLNANPGVRAQTIEGQPVAGITIRFEVVSGGGQVTVSNQTTDVDGVARITTWVLGPTAGENQLSAGVPGQTVDVLIIAAGIAGEANTVTIVAGNNQTGVAGRPVQTSPTVRVTDQFENSIPAVPVQFTVAGGGGTLTDGPPIMTNSVGEARAPIWFLGPAPGTNMLTVNAGLGTATISATGIAGPTNVRITAGADQVAVVGQQVGIAPQFLVVDAQEIPVARATVRFSPTIGGNVSTAQATTDVNGVAQVDWTLSTIAGQNSLAVTVNDIPPVLLTAEGIPDTPSEVVVVAGNNQFGEVNEAVLTSPAVRVTDQFANAVPNVAVTFAITTGNGSITDSVVVSDSIGVSSLGTWLLGPTPGANTLNASIAAGANAIINATALTAVFDIQIVREGGGGTNLTDALNKAVIKWRSVIVGDLPDMSFAANPIPAASCGGQHDEIVDTIDDLRILVFVRNIDGIGGTVAQAGPCVTRDPGLLPVLGAMTFDAQDIDNLDNGGVLDDVALHEMGHILGIGTLWDTLGFLANPSLPGSAGADTHFTGPLAIAAFDSIGGVGFPESKVPVENTRGGPGTRDSHWREETMTNENMTGFIDPGTNPLSAVTVQSLADLGYLVNLFGADDFSLPFNSPAMAQGIQTSPRRIHLVGDVRTEPIVVVQRNGRITAIIRP